jgi:hypothetical protein
MDNDLIFALKNIYDKCGFRYTEPIFEKESIEYAACTFEVNEQSVKFRKAKITPKKNGLFVTIWKRNEKGMTEPYNASDPIDLFVINVRNDNYFGQFVFPKSVLIQHGIVTDKKEGKRGIRVYPPWDMTTNKQAQKTQKWQLDYFLDASLEKPLDKVRAEMLFTKS